MGFTQWYFGLRTFSFDCTPPIGHARVLENRSCFFVFFWRLFFLICSCLHKHTHTLTEEIAIVLLFKVGLSCEKFKMVAGEGRAVVVAGWPRDTPD
jgi:hypothetical protein